MRWAMLRRMVSASVESDVQSIWVTDELEQGAQGGKRNFFQTGLASERAVEEAATERGVVRSAEF